MSDVITPLKAFMEIDVKGVMVSECSCVYWLKIHLIHVS